MNERVVRGSVLCATLAVVAACEKQAAPTERLYGDLIDERSAVIFGEGVPELHSVGSVLLMSSGEIVIENRGTHSILVFDTAGNHRRSIGRAGAGPEEFLGLWGVWPDARGDSLFAWDVLSTKLATWTVAGTYINSQRIQSKVSLKPQGRFRDGSILAARTPQHQRMAPGDIRELDATLYRVFPGADSMVPLLDLRWENTAAGENPRGRAGPTYVTQPFGPRARIVVTDTSFYYTSGETWSIYGYSWLGTPLDSIVFDRPVMPLTTEIRSQYIDWSVDGSPKEVKQGVLRFQNSLSFPRTLPTYEELLLDTSGNLWAGEFVAPFAPQVRAWHVFGPTGEKLGTTQIRADIIPATITRTHVLGRARGASDIEIVFYAPIANDPRGQTTAAQR